MGFNFGSGAASGASSAFSVFKPQSAASSTSTEPERDNKEDKAEGEKSAGDGDDAGAESGSSARGIGEGEEDEEVLGSELRAKLYVLNSGKWEDRGVGIFKVKRNTTTNKVRMLGRNASNGNPMLVSVLRTATPSFSRT